LSKIPILTVDSPLPQADLNPEVRNILLNWLYEVVDVHKICTQTYFLTIHYLDNLIRLIPIKKYHFQLWGCVCLLLASKMEEMKVPEIATLIYMAGSCFTAVNVQYCEEIFLMLTCQREINLTTRFSFLDYYSHLVNLSDRERYFYQYLLELSLFDVSLSHEMASKIAAAALHLSLQSTRDYHIGTSDANELWDSYLIKHTGYEEEELAPIIQRIHALHWNTDISSPTSIASVCDNLLRKYDQRSYLHVSSTIFAVPFDRLWLGWQDHHERIRNRDHQRMRMTSNNHIFISPTCSVEENLDGHCQVSLTSSSSPPAVAPISAKKEALKPTSHEYEVGTTMKPLKRKKQVSVVSK
jgi:hypothetical protein